MKQSTTIGIDISKSVFALSVSEEPGKVVARERMSRKRLVEYFQNREPATVVMEACGMSHYWGRELKKLGHEVRLLPPHYTCRYVLRDKTDAADADGLLEANRNEKILAVPVKSVDQQAVMALHRIREKWTEDRTARLNLIRGLLRELGIVIPVGAGNVLPVALEMLADADSAIPISIRDEVFELCDEVRPLEARKDSIDKKLAALAKQMPEVRLLMTIPGIGVITATALVAFIGDVRRFKNCRQLASYLGLVPREHSTAQRRFLGAISKRGSTYLRCLLVHGARSALRVAGKYEDIDGLRAWALTVKTRRGHNKAVVALANKLARVIWAVWRRSEPYKMRPVLAR